MDEGVAIGLFVAGFGGLVAMALCAVAVRLGWIGDDVCVCCGEDGEQPDPRDDGDYDRV